jgi:hypothetical protein
VSLFKKKVLRDPLSLAVSMFYWKHQEKRAAPFKYMRRFRQEDPGAFSDRHRAHIHVFASQDDELRAKLPDYSIYGWGRAVALILRVIGPVAFLELPFLRVRTIGFFVLRFSSYLLLSPLFFCALSRRRPPSYLPQYLWFGDTVVNAVKELVMREFLVGFVHRFDHLLVMLK